jgi:hypothetical protein
MKATAKPSLHVKLRERRRIDNSESNEELKLMCWRAITCGLVEPDRKNEFCFGTAPYGFAVEFS